MQQLVKGQEVSLGCGTLILIALIVAFFSTSTKPMPNLDLSPVMNKLNEIEMNKLNEIDQRLQRLERKLDELHKPRFEKIEQK